MTTKPRPENMTVTIEMNGRTVVKEYPPLETHQTLLITIGSDLTVYCDDTNGPLGEKGMASFI